MRSLKTSVFSVSADPVLGDAFWNAGNTMASPCVTAQEKARAAGLPLGTWPVLALASFSMDLGVKFGETSAASRANRDFAD